MPVLEKINYHFENTIWVDSTRNSLPFKDGYKLEIFHQDSKDGIQDLVKMFTDLFAFGKNNLIIGKFPLDTQWGAFCIDSYNIGTNEINYDFISSSNETIAYLNMLLESGINFDYMGVCKCNDWSFFLDVILRCIILHIAPYSPCIYNIRDKYFFYFHHTISIGVLYKERSEAIEEIIAISQKNGYVVDSIELNE